MTQPASSQNVLLLFHHAVWNILAFLFLKIRHTKKNPRLKKRCTSNKSFQRSGILWPHFHTTAWRRLVLCGTEGEFVAATSFPRSLFFRDLLPWFQDHRKTVLHGSPFRITNSKAGRKPLLCSEDILGLALWYLKSGDVDYSLTPIFGITPASVSEWLNFALEVLWWVVRDKSHPEFQIRWQTKSEMEESCALLQQHRPNAYMLRGVFGVTDGARLPCPDFDDPDTQNAFYNAMNQRVEATNLLVWNFKGEIIHACVNFPGSMHDSKLAYLSGLYWPLLVEDSNTPPGFAVLGDSAFVNDTRNMKGKVVRARKCNEMRTMPISSGCAAIDLALQRIYPKERETAEWGVRGLKGPFRRLTRTLPANHYKRGRMLSLACHLVNYRVRMYGGSQIAVVYGGDRERYPFS